jgi:hypothetical protein
MKKPIHWRWSVFGQAAHTNKDGTRFTNELMVIDAVLHAPLWRRILTRILLGSTWKKMEADE